MLSRLAGCGLALLVAAAPARAADPPEKYLSPTTQFYLRWDGVTPHQAAYEASALGAVMKGPTGDTLRTLLARLPKTLGSTLLAEPLLEGKSPAELRAVHADLKSLEKLTGLLADTGVVVAVDVRGPQPTLKGLGAALGGLLGGDQPKDARPEQLVPEVRVYFMVPNAGDRADLLFAPTRLFNRAAPFGPAVALPAASGVKGYRWPSAGNGPFHSGEWVIDGHFVEYLGTVPVEAAVARMKADAAAGGATAHPLLQRCTKAGDFESVARGFVDADALVGLANQLAGPFVPGLADKLNAAGVGNLKAVAFSSGFKGKESRALYEFDLPGERKGVAKLFKPAPITLADLPPLPPDVSRFSLLRLDPTTAYDAGLGLIDALVQEPFGVDADDKDKSPAEISRLRQEFLDRSLNKAVGLNVRADLFAHLGDKVVVFQSPTEGPSVFGTVLCVSVKDAAKVRTAAAQLTRAAEAVAGGQLKVRKKLVGGVEVREVYGRDFTFFTPTYAVVGDWLVVAGHPQPVQGLILRHSGALERWKPDADTTARLGTLPADAIGLQYCHPKSSVQNICCVGPVLVNLVGLGRRFQRGTSDFDPPDVGMVPNGHELSRHLFPNLTVTRDDGTTVRVEVNESFSLPLEFIGAEPFLFAFGTAAFRF